MYLSPEYNVWRGMIIRCTDPSHDSFKHYGGRGITVCDRWATTFEPFYADMGPRPTRQHKLERLNNSLGYGPDNCAWVTHLEQMHNTRRNHKLTFQGQTLCIAEWSRKTGLAAQTIHNRLGKGWTTENALTIAPNINNRKHKFSVYAHGAIPLSG